jgi:peptidoglycan-associated lipoprotein
MLKRLSTTTVIVLTVVFAISCATKKKKADDVPAGGAEGSTLDSNIGSQDMSFDAKGSDGGQINGLASVHFDYDSSTLSSESRRQLSDNAEWIKANKATVQVEGHCDSRGSAEYNLALGERRAKAVKNYLVSLGIDSKRMTIISYGEEKPLVTGDSEEAYAKNRRVNFVPLAQ